MSEKKLILYDIPSKGNKCWSPNTWKVRLALRYKRIHFETVWLHYREIKPIVGVYCQPGKEVPTLPTIKHGDTWVYDSFEIIKYLENTFPHTPSLFHPSLPTITLFQTFHSQILILSMYGLLIPLTPAILSKEDAEYYRWRRALDFGVPFEQYGVGAGVRDWKEALGVVVSTLGETGEPYILGDELSYADILILALLLWQLKLNPSVLEETFALYDGSKGGAAFRRWYERVLPIAKEDL